MISSFIQGEIEFSFKLAKHFPRFSKKDLSPIIHEACFEAEITATPSVHMYSYLVPVKSVVTSCTHFDRPKFLAVQMNCQVQKPQVATVLTLALTLL